MAQTILHMFAERARDHGLKDQIAVRDGDRALTYPALLGRVGGRAGALARAGLGTGERIALLQNRHTGLVIDILAVMACGCSFSVISRRESEQAVSEKLRAAGFAALIVDDANAQRGKRIADGAGLAVIHAQAPAPSADLMPDVPAETEACIIFTSGSSGPPKAVKISHANIVSNTRGMLAMTPFGPDDHFLHVMPLSHTNGVMNQLLAPLAAGAEITLLERFVAENFIAAMTRYHPSIITGVPTIFQRLLSYPIPESVKAGLRFIRCGSAPLSPEMQARIEDHFQTEVIVSYGQTETTCTCTSNPPGARKIGSVGRVLAGQEVAVLPPDRDTPLGRDVIGEIAVRGPNIAMGYVGREDFSPTAWLRTGDNGYFDQDGYLFLTGRQKEVIIRGGENLSPGQIEEMIIRYGGVTAVCVCGAPDHDLGEVPVAFVELSSQDPPDLGDLNRFIRAHLSPAHEIIAINVLNKLPQNLVGKIDRKKLAQSLQPSPNGPPGAA